MPRAFVVSDFDSKTCEADLAGAVEGPDVSQAVTQATSNERTPTHIRFRIALPMVENGFITGLGARAAWTSEAKASWRIIKAPRVQHFHSGKGRFWPKLAIPTRERPVLGRVGYSHAGKAGIGQMWLFPRGKGRFWSNLAISTR
jgi:hypothetical protein